MDKILFTIGHSSHPIKTLIDYFDQHQVDTVFDVRSNPYSRFHPQYRHEPLKNSLSMHGIRYSFLGNSLGARPNDPECYVNGQVDFNRLAGTIKFREGLAQLIEEIAVCRGCLFCAEKEPLSCHRFILVCRHLRHQPIKIRHILADGSVEPHENTEIRLVQMLGLTQMELFSENNDLVERAYKMQEQKIVYQR